MRLAKYPILAAAGMLLTWGCGPGESTGEPAAAPNELVTEEVAAPVDAAVDVDADPKAIARSHESVGGVLPSDFPASFTLPRPASIIDLSSTDDGWSTVVLRTPSSPGQVAGFFARELPRGGWTEYGGLWMRDRTQVRVTVKVLPDGARVQLDYRTSAS
jgi:hypothetical protein